MIYLGRNMFHISQFGSLCVRSALRSCGLWALHSRRRGQAPGISGFVAHALRDGKWSVKSGRTVKHREQICTNGTIDVCAILDVKQCFKYSRSNHVSIRNTKPCECYSNHVIPFGIQSHAHVILWARAANLAATSVLNETNFSSV